MPGAGSCSSEPTCSPSQSGRLSSEQPKRTTRRLRCAPGLLDSAVLPCRIEQPPGRHGLPTDADLALPDSTQRRQPAVAIRDAWPADARRSDFGGRVVIGPFFVFGLLPIPDCKHGKSHYLSWWARRSVYWAFPKAYHIETGSTCSSGQCWNCVKEKANNNRRIGGNWYVGQVASR